jgi:putative hemolysin
MELGRSFIQRKYWSGNYLDYLWYGIGEYVRRNRNICLMYGSISIGNNYSLKAKSYIKAFVDKWYAEYDNEITCIEQYQINEEDYKEMNSLMNGEDPKFDLKALKHKLEEMGFSVPPLLKKYLNITEIGGAKIKSSAFEPTFNASSFLLVLDIRQLKELYRDRYFPFLNK